MKINHPHDRLFGFTFNDKPSVIQFAQKFFPAEIAENLVFDSFQKEDTSYINEELQPFYSDKVWSCEWKGTKKRVKVSFLFEHKSNIENPWLQLLRYQLEGYRNQIQQQQEINRSQKVKNRLELTVIIPVIFYHGAGKWHYRPFEEYFELPHPSLKSYIPSFDYLLTDLSTYSNEELFALEVGFLLSTLLLLKHKNDKRFIKQYHQEVFIFVKELRHNPSTDSFLEIMVLYILRTYNLTAPEVKEIVENLPPKVKNLTMSTYDRLIAEGKVIGIREGELKSTIQFALSTIVKLPQLSNKKIADLFNLEEVFIQEIRNALKQKKLAKLNQVILKEFQKNGITDKVETSKFKELVKKYYSLFHKKEN